MSCLLKNNERGFTILELLVGLTVSILLLGAAVKLLVLQQEVFNEEEEVTEMEQNIRVAMDIIVREAKMAGYNPSGAAFDGIEYDATRSQLEIRKDLDGDGNPGDPADADEHVIYQYDAGDSEIDRADQNTGVTQPIAENIYQLDVGFLDEDGNTTNISGNIHSVWVRIIGKTATIDTRIDDYKYGTLTSTITPVNLIYDDQ